MAIELSESSLISNSSGRVAVALSRRFLHTLQQLLHRNARGDSAKVHLSCNSAFHLHPLNAQFLQIYL